MTSKDIPTAELVRIYNESMAAHPGDHETGLEIALERVYAAACEDMGRRVRIRRRGPQVAHEKVRMPHAKAIRREAEPYLEAVAAMNGITVKDLLEAENLRIGRIRFQAMFVLRSLPQRWSTTDIAIALRMVNHTSVVWGLRKIEARFEEEPGLRDDLLAIAWRRAALRSVA